MAEYMILMRENDGAWGSLSPDEQQALLERYFAWVEQLKQDGVFCGGKPLGSGGGCCGRSTARSSTVRSPRPRRCSPATS